MKKKINKIGIVGKARAIGGLQWKIFLGKEKVKLQKTEEETAIIATYCKNFHKNFNLIWPWV